MLQKKGIVYNIVYLFNEDGNLYESRKLDYSYDSNGREFRITYKYDSNKNMIEKIENSFGNEERETYKYDINGKKIESTKYNIDGSVFHKCLYVYDEKKDNLELDYYNAEGTIIQEKITWV